MTSETTLFDQVCEKIPVYLAGPYVADSELEIQQNIARAAIWSAYLWIEGYAVFCPHMNSANLHKLEGVGNFNRQMWIDGDIVLLRAIAAAGGRLFVMPGWDKSSGTIAEIDEWKHITGRIGAFLDAESLPKPYRKALNTISMTSDSERAVVVKNAIWVLGHWMEDECLS